MNTSTYTLPVHKEAPHFVIVGGVAGGMSAATRLRRVHEQARITVIEKSAYVSYANCGLPYYAGGVISNHDSLILQTPESLASRFKIRVLTSSEVTDINPQERLLTYTYTNTDGQQTEEYMHYDELILSPGAAPFVPDIPGIERAHVLRNVEDVEKITESINTSRHAVVIGGGFVGLEIAENLHRRGLDVHVIEAGDHILAPFDPEMAAMVSQAMSESGIHIHSRTHAQRIEKTSVVIKRVNSSEKSPSSTEVETENIEADLVICAVGVRPQTELARKAGIALGEYGGIKVDENLRTNLPHIYAVGDAVEKIDAISGKPRLLALANTANLQGRNIASLIGGALAEKYPVNRGVRGTSIIGVSGLQAARTGWSEKEARQAGRAITVIHTHPFNHATYYPGANQLALKLIVDAENDEILGAQAVGKEGADKRIDVIATAMAGGLKASDLAHLELSYAPQFGSAKDPINMLGFIASNIFSSQAATIQWHELDEALSQGAILIDVRTEKEFARGSIPGSINIPLDTLREKIDSLTEGEIIVSCAVGQRGHTAASLLSQYGKHVRNLDGGYRTWCFAHA